jgi:pyridoxal phosphate enzyme (YggS family)
LQRNKVKYVVGTACLIHTVASRSVLEEIEHRAAAAEVQQEVLVQLNLSGESTKSGILEAELEPLLDSFASCAHVRCAGLMTMPPFFDDPDRARPLFARLRDLRDRAAETVRTNVDLHHLSMGMSGDFEVAIEEGATLVRIGTAITGPRT